MVLRASLDLARQPEYQPDSNGEAADELAPVQSFTDPQGRQGDSENGLCKNG